MCSCCFVYQKSALFYCSVFHACVVSCFNRVQLFVTLWTVACQAPLSLEFPRQEYWSGLPCPPLGDLPNPGIKPESPAWQADSSPTEPPGKTPNYKQIMKCFLPLVCKNINYKIHHSSNTLRR